MPGEAKAPDTFQARAIRIIGRIPEGRVATYGQIAGLAGNPRAARQVVRVLHTSSSKERLPWHRVINSRGEIGLRRGEGYEIQKAKLETEGVVFSDSDKVDLREYLWEPGEHVRD